MRVCGRLIQWMVSLFKTCNKHLGIGMAIWPDGRKYVGNYVKDKKEGNGTF